MLCSKDSMTRANGIRFPFGSNEDDYDPKVALLSGDSSKPADNSITSFNPFDLGDFSVPGVTLSVGGSTEENQSGEEQEQPDGILPGDGQQHADEAGKKEVQPVFDDPQVGSGASKHSRPLRPQQQKKGKNSLRPYKSSTNAAVSKAKATKKEVKSNDDPQVGSGTSKYSRPLRPQRQKKSKNRLRPYKSSTNAAVSKAKATRKEVKSKDCCPAERVPCQVHRNCWIYQIFLDNPGIVRCNVRECRSHLCMPNRECPNNRQRICCLQNAHSFLSQLYCENKDDKATKREKNIRRQEFCDTHKVDDKDLFKIWDTIKTRWKRRGKVKCPLCKTMLANDTHTINRHKRVKHALRIWASVRPKLAGWNGMVSRRG